MNHRRCGRFAVKNRVPIDPFDTELLIFNCCLTDIPEFQNNQRSLASEFHMTLGHTHTKKKPIYGAWSLNFAHFILHVTGNNILSYFIF